MSRTRRPSLGGEKFPARSLAGEALRYHAGFRIPEMATMQGPARLMIAYAAFAAVATMVNVVTQTLCFRIYAGYGGVVAAMAFGTVAGLVAKYVLDKRYIFRFRARNVLHDSRTFVLYTLMGVATTAVFWAFELGFYRIFGGEFMRYVGGVIGLVIGYVTKFHLDKRYVFRPGLS